MIDPVSGSAPSAASGALNDMRQETPGMPGVAYAVDVARFDAAYAPDAQAVAAVQTPVEVAQAGPVDQWVASPPEAAQTPGDRILGGIEGAGASAAPTEAAMDWTRPQPAAAATDAAPTLGDRILSGLDGVRGQWGSMEQAVSDVAANFSSPIDAMRLQFQMVALTTSSNFVINETSSLAKKFDELLKAG